jgi:hypothetical protein
MHQRSRLQRLSRLLMRQLCHRQLPQLFIDKRQKLFGSFRIAGVDL